MSKLNEIIRSAWEAAINTGKEVKLADLADDIIRENRAALEDEKDRLIRASVLKDLKKIAGATADDSGQMDLFGFPAVIAIPDGADYVYLRATSATYDKLVAGRSIRQENVNRAQSKLDTYNLALRRVKPIMEGTTKTLMDAVSNSN